MIANFPALIQNDGIEASLTSLNIKGNKFSWSTDLNFTIPRNRLKSFPGLETSPYANTYELNKPINIIKTFKSKGVNPSTGLYEFYDSKGSVVSDPSADFANYTQTIDPNPKYYGGFNNSLTYKGLSLSILFQFVKQIGKNAPYVGNPPGNGKINQPKYILNRWQKDGDIAPYQKYTSSKFDVMQAFFYQLQSDAYWVNASFVRCKNISLSYDFPKKFLLNGRVNDCRLYFNAQNVFTVTPYKGLDPETQSNFTMPPLRVLTIGLRVTL